MNTNSMMAETNAMNEVRSTTQYDMVEQLAAKMSISLEEARNALEAADWNMLTATHTLELEEVRRKQELDVAAAAAEKAAAEKAAAEGRKHAGKGRAAFKNVGDHIRRLIACGNRNRFVVRRNGEQLLDLPVTVLAILLLCSFGTCAFLLVIGLFAGCRYSFNGQDAAAAARA